MENYSKELLRTGIIEAKAGNKNTARRYLDRAIYMAGAHDVLAEAWFWMGEVADGPVEKRKALENCLSHDLRHARARRSLAILDGKLKVDQVVNPDQLPAAPEGLRDADAQRFMCPKCGGRMSFEPQGQSLLCDYCTRDHAPAVGLSNDEKDFIIAMATMKGHGRPLQEQVFHCSGCGAEFILPPGQISANCVYCNSPHVVSLEKSKDLLAPDVIIPHAFDQKHAIKLLIRWVQENKIKPQKQVDLPRGLYLPLWTFDIGGVIDYTGEMFESRNDGFIKNDQRNVIRVTDQYPVMLDDWPLPASRKLSAVFLKLIPAFDLKSLKPYDARFLASWPAEIYDVPMADASLEARSQAFRKYKNELPRLLNGINIIHTSSANLVVESFRLNLLPVWMTVIPFDGREHLVLINGQSGVVASDLPGQEQEETSDSGSLFSFLADLLDD
ncbi:MAG: TFIIB-type zinc ribbon-containing protein [Anaerolineales bacterium]